MERCCESAAPRTKSWNGVFAPQAMFCFWAGSPRRKTVISSLMPTRVSRLVQLVLAGGGSRRDAYYHEILGHASNRVRLLEYVSGDAFDELLTNAMLFVLPSDLEGLSLALLEAMGAGLCVLASDIPENRELVEGAGFLFRPGDVGDLERMLRLLMNDNQMREEAGKAAQERIREHYLWPGITAQIEQIYQEMMGAGEPESVAPA